MPTSSSKTTVNVAPIVAGVAAIFCFTMAAVVAIVFAVPDGGNAGSLIALLFGALAATVAAMVTLAKVARIEEKVDDLSNGRMDAKIRAGVAAVVRDEHIDPAVKAQLVEDRKRVGEH